MTLIIYKTHKRVHFATATFTVSSVADYINYLAKFDIQIDEMDAAKDLVIGAPVELTIPVDAEYMLDA